MTLKSNTEMAPIVYCIGETVLDIIFRDGRPVSATPGGSMLNSAVSLGRAGIKVEFISEYGNDETGGIIDSFLHENNTGTRYIRRYDDGKTPLALAFLDKPGNASYSFYTSYPRIRLKDPLPDVKNGDVILFGSIYSITPGIHGKIRQWIHKARNRGAFIIYDPNFRKSHAAGLEKVRPWIIENIAMADIVRGSDEDFINIFAVQTPDDMRTKIRSFGCKNIIITRNSKSLVAWFDEGKMTMEILPVKPLVSTIGAGDAFNAGIIFALVREGITKGTPGNTGAGNARKIIETGVEFAAEVCKSFENYISPDFGKCLKL